MRHALDMPAGLLIAVFGRLGQANDGIELAFDNGRGRFDFTGQQRSPVGEQLLARRNAAILVMRAMNSSLSIGFVRKSVAPWPGACRDRHSSAYWP